MRRLSVVVVVALAACKSVSPGAQSSQTPNVHPVPTVLDTPVEFVGPRRDTLPAGTTNEIRLGLFAPITAEHPVGLAMYEGGSLAIEQFNSRGGFDGVPIRLITRWDEDPWRGGSKEMTKLVYEDSVLAVVGSVDGAATHVAEQVVTKAWLPLLSPVSADPTLTYIRIPWMFRLPPNDEKQATALIRDGILANSLSSVGLITATDHDGRIFGEEMLTQMSAAQTTPAFHLQVSLQDLDIEELTRRVESFETDAVVVRLPAENLLSLLEAFDTAGINVPVMIPWVPGLLLDDLKGRYIGKISCVAPFSESDNAAYSAFRREFRERYATSPSPTAAYSFDAINIVIRALANRMAGGGGFSRAGLRDGITDESGYVGATGTIVWDNAGGNRSQPVVRVILGRGTER